MGRFDVISDANGNVSRDNSRVVTEVIPDSSAKTIAHKFPMFHLSNSRLGSVENGRNTPQMYPSQAYLEPLLEQDDIKVDFQQTKKEGSKFLAISQKTGSQPIFSLAELSNYAKETKERESVANWLEFEAPTRADLNVIEKTFGLHPVTTEDIFATDSPEKREYFERYLFLVVHELDEETQGTVVINIVVFADLVITVHQKPVRSVSTVISRLQRLPSKVVASADWIAYALVDSITDIFVTYSGMVEKEVDSVDDLVLLLPAHERNDALERIRKARRLVGSLKAVLTPRRELLLSLTVKDASTQLIRPTMQAYLRDVLDHVNSVLQKMETARDTLTSAQSNYLAKISVELAISADQTNRTMRKVGLASVIFMPLTLISGVFGMNINLPFQTGTERSTETLDPFWIMMGIFGAFAVVCLAAFRWRQKHRV